MKYFIYNKYRINLDYDLYKCIIYIFDNVYTCCVFYLKNDIAYTIY